MASDATTEERVALVVRLTAAFREEVARRGAATPVPWPHLPDVGALLAHVGTVQRWTTAVLRTGGPVAEAGLEQPTDDPLEWYDRGRDELLEALAGADDRPCWTIGNRAGTASFWPRRMVFEHAKHLMDARAAGGAGWALAPELSAADYADGLDELFAVFLRRSRPTLPPLPGSVDLLATDAPRGWRVERDWTVSVHAAAPRADAVVRATAGHLALALWERADFADPAFHVEGDRESAAALDGAAIHPW